MSDTTPVIPEFTRDTEAMRDIRSFQDALDLLKGSNIPLVDSKEFGDGFEICEDKAELVGVPFVILGIRFGESDYGAPDSGEKFSVLHVVTGDGRKRIIVDGGTGIGQQAQDIAKNHPNGGAGVMVEKGLTRSDYIYVNEKGERSPATTFYLS